MKRSVTIAALALFALGGSLSAASADDRTDSAPAASQPAVDDLPHFLPSANDAAAANLAPQIDEAAALTPAADFEIAEEAEEIGGGMASFYGRELAGRPTASGERFDPSGLTAAHRTLPFGSKVRVTNARNGRSVVVRINDRGPFHGNRLIDLSHGAAESIGLVSAGSGRVELALLGS
ncbi:septal ring lytic transglycosylase RlpA family protein [Altererythrobacter xixiisoli]|uniref:Endolytic peptidoglycan transglycosylase RlpA n=1 Tax=Croceibacterium xixiisoli TaxID=1476466 RepID=A0A6I4TSK4_9SPHN|nr:septal ring lytic transglycosylase RlpA family protein [Croceibacterium xixiisoli]MXO98872.1 septal ring lytic transglycosylase RlpA family protein [Croceibacterium xixiisoli]